ncbi:SDR family oxidoreductase [Streptacidiphilus sp. EB103A]|uniref:SDR family oxidoreductase n=1 Tax=Streptacidiphilus sp. EB103A TaxID=3156275 RepID=UPI003514B90D
MSVVITGATGHLGRLVVESLLEAGTPADDIVATGRDAAKLEQVGSRGVTTRRVDFADLAPLEAAFAGAESLLLVSTTTVGERFANHRRAIDAARAGGVKQLVYTSSLNAATARMRLAEEHRRTEEYLRESGIPFVILRNGWYLENYTGQLPLIRQHGVLLGSARDGAVSAASRRDYADAAAVALTQTGHEGATYELGGEPFTLSDLAATIGEELGTHITYRDLPVAAYAEALTGAGLPAEMATVLADADAGLARGELYTDSDDLPRLIGRAATTHRDAVRAALAHGSVSPTSA